jgi:hypothetical protein
MIEINEINLLKNDLSMEDISSIKEESSFEDNLSYEEESSFEEESTFEDDSSFEVFSNPKYSKDIVIEEQYYDETTKNNALSYFDNMYNMIIKREFAINDKKENKYNIFNIGEILLNFFFECYRGTIGIFLVIFVPQHCLKNNDENKDSCNLLNNIYNGYPDYDAIFIINIFTAFLFSILYFFELFREYVINKYLVINKYDKSGILGIHASPDSEILYDNSLKNMNDKCLPNKSPIYNNKITCKIIYDLKKYNNIYKILIIFSFILYFINTIVSISIILKYNSMNRNSYIGIITNIGIFLPKLYDMLFFVTLNKNEFIKNTYSSYKKTFEQYNNYSDYICDLIKFEIDKAKESYIKFRNKYKYIEIKKKIEDLDFYYKSIDHNYNYNFNDNFNDNFNNNYNNNKYDNKYNDKYDDRYVDHDIDLSKINDIENNYGIIINNETDND